MQSWRFLTLSAVTLGTLFACAGSDVSTVDTDSGPGPATNADGGTAKDSGSAPENDSGSSASCAAGQTDCSGACKDLAVDSEHCGQCGAACPSGQVCSAGTCATSCGAQLVACGAQCIDPKTSNAFCGATGDCKGNNAGTACPADKKCSQGACVPVCFLNEVLCSGTCRDTESDPLHCGNCGTTCPVPAGANTAAKCTSKVCGAACSPGFVDCNRDLGQANGDGCETAAATGCTYDFGYTGNEQTFIVPSGITSIAVVLEGAQGGTDNAAIQNYGGKVSATLAVSLNELLYLYVGGQPAGEAGGYNGGGAGDNGGKGGGGATDIRRAGNGLADRILVAGGGGGGGKWSNLDVVGGKGGGLDGQAGFRAPNDPGGKGGTQVGSGTGTCVSFDVATVSGALGVGGTTVGKNCGCLGFGGGGGYYGGAASGNCRGGGGGSAFTAAQGVTNVVHELGGAAPGNGHIRIHVSF